MNRSSCLRIIVESMVARPALFMAIAAGARGYQFPFAPRDHSQRSRVAPCALMSAEAEDVIARLQTQMEAAVDVEDYAGAALLRDQINALSEPDVAAAGGALPTTPSRTAHPGRSATKPPMSLRQRVEDPQLVSEADAQRTSVKRLPRFLSDADIESIHAAADTARAEAEAAGFKVSATYERQVREGGRTVWLNHRVLALLPGLHGRMMAAAKAADRELWGGVLDNRLALNLRSSEYHLVTHDAADASRNIPMPVHADYGSLITINLMLSDISEYEGGVFQTLEPGGSLLAHTFERGDALVLLSHKWHAVSQLEAGRRNILVSEIWEGLPRRCPQRCDQPWLPCLCRMTEDGVHVSGAEARGVCWRDGLTDAERLLVNGRAFWEQQHMQQQGEEDTSQNNSQPQEGEEGAESLQAWARAHREKRRGDHSSEL